MNISYLSQLQSDDHFVQYDAIIAMRNEGYENAVPELLQSLDSLTNASKVVAIALLYKLDYQDENSTICATLLHCLDDEDGLVRVDAMEMAWLFDCRSQEMISKITRLLLTDHDFLVRVQAAESLGELNVPEAVPMLLRMLHDTHYLVRSYVADALGRIGETVSIQPINRLLEFEETEFVQVHLMIALLRMDALEDTSQLLKTIKTVDNVYERDALIRMVKEAAPDNDELLLEFEESKFVQVHLMVALLRINALEDTSQLLKTIEAVDNVDEQEALIRMVKEAAPDNDELMKAIIS